VYQVGINKGRSLSCCIQSDNFHICTVFVQFHLQITTIYLHCHHENFRIIRLDTVRFLKVNLRKVNEISENIYIYSDTSANEDNSFRNHIR